MYVHFKFNVKVTKMNLQVYIVEFEDTSFWNPFIPLLTPPIVMNQVQIYLKERYNLALHVTYIDYQIHYPRLSYIKQ